MAFIRTLIARMKAEHSVSDKHVYVFGFSNGGHMTIGIDPIYASQPSLAAISSLTNQELQPALGALCLARCVAQIFVQAGFAAELFPSKAVAH
jgi:poly(3-hydroxybutyrate) depolymerase